MGCFSKLFLFVLNFIVFAIGVAVVVLASIVIANGSQFQDLLTKGSFTVPIILLILGIVVMLIGFFGCFGALRESPCLLYTYATIVLLLLIGQIAVAVYGLVKQDDIKEFISDNMIKVFQGYGGEDQKLTQSLDAAQHDLKCCGVHNYTDWLDGTIPDANMPTGSDLPLGCCKNLGNTCNVGLNNPDAASLVYTQGCYTLLITTIEGEALWLIIGAIVLALVQLLSVLIACGIGKKASRHEVY